LVGNLSGTINPGLTPNDPPSVTVVSGTSSVEGISHVIEVNLALSITQVNGGGDSIDGVISVPQDTYVEQFNTLVIYVSGAIFEAGSLIAADGNGTVPIANGSTLVTTGAVVVEPDLFTA
jgi:hypothetical protein